MVMPDASVWLIESDPNTRSPPGVFFRAAGHDKSLSVGADLQRTYPVRAAGGLVAVSEPLFVSATAVCRRTFALADPA